MPTQSFPLDSGSFEYEREVSALGTGGVLRLFATADPLDTNNGCEAGMDKSAGGEFCVKVLGREKCGGITFGHEGRCTAQQTCNTPPVASCDASTACCSSRFFGTPSFSISPQVGIEHELSVFGVGYELEAEIGVQLTVDGTVSLESERGPGCACQTNADALDFSFSGTGGGFGQAQIELFGKSIEVGVEAELCVSMGLEAPACGPLLDPHGGARLTVGVGGIDVWFIELEPHQLDIVNYGQGC